MLLPAAPHVEELGRVVEHRVNGSPAEVFQYFTDPVKHRRWHGRDVERLNAAAALVVADLAADLADGLLIIDLVREVPEAMKPKKISVGGYFG